MPKTAFAWLVGFLLPAGRRQLIPALLVAWSAIAVAPTWAAASASEQAEFFEKKIRPILVEHCFACHSGKAKKLQAGLRLDSRSAMLRGGDSGPAVVPNDPGESLLLSAVRYESFEMPPRGKLPEGQIALLQQWIAQGAYWPSDAGGLADDQPAPANVFDWRERKAAGWAWHVLAEPAVPAVRDTQWPLTPVDAFILARLEAAGLRPAAEADRATLLRRLSFDLIGLPPSPAQIQSFVQDESADAYEHQVDRLLRSPQFGEKWARHWLDLVRFAETCGHEFDYPLPLAWRYRDYVVRAFNADVPYNQFVVEHLAGDLLAEPRRHPTEAFNESIIGTGFWFLGEAVHAPTDVRGDEADRIDNQLDVVSKTFLGVTLACARCHDHKFDPIPTADYYALAGYLQSSRRQEALLDPGRKIQQATGKLDAVLHDGTSALTDLWTADDADISSPQFGERLAPQIEGLAAEDLTNPWSAWRAVADANEQTFPAQWQAFVARVQRARREAADREANVQWFADFRQGDLARWYRTGDAFLPQETAGRQWDSLAADPALAMPGVAHSGLRAKRLQGVIRSPTFTLRHRQIHYRMQGEGVQIRLIVDGYTMDTFNALLFADATLENVKTDGRWRWITQRRDLDHYLGHRAHLEIIDHGGGFAAVERIGFSDEGPPPEPLSDFVLSLIDNPPPKSRQDLLARYQQALAAAVAASENRSTSGDQILLLNPLLRAGLLPIDRDGWEGAVRRRQAIDDALPEPVHVMALCDGDGENERIHIRGSHKNLGPEVPRRMLLAIAGEDQPPPPSGSGRLALAERFTNPANPLISRVLVNRLWHHLFSRGIVATVDDFGAMGSGPTHPQLLDWLAGDFIDHGWSVKHAIKQMVMSRTYRMTAALSDRAAEAADPENLLWHRNFVRRLPAESIRDNLLAVSGRLQLEQFGPSVPVHLTPFMEGRGRPRSGPLDGNGRRSIYIKIQRNFLSPMMLAFDMPSPFSTMGRRSMSNVPAQSLILMNDPFVWQQAEIWAERLSASSADPRLRIDQAFQEAFGRSATEEEQSRVQQFIQQQSRLYGASEEDRRVWTDVCHALFNMKEFIYLQ